MGDHVESEEIHLAVNETRIVVYAVNFEHSMKKRNVLKACLMHIFENGVVIDEAKVTIGNLKRQELLQRYCGCGKNEAATIIKQGYKKVKSDFEKWRARMQYLRTEGGQGGLLTLARAYVVEADLADDSRDGEQKKGPDDDDEEMEARAAGI